ncbi:serine/threonine-protein kinase 32C-like isoform X3 [Oreochromis aureus]|uniref:serine/threonine-protein kinase 32C-like isoform X3 n=1 Tax=Oreochromis aureus TaxID=47969 RepID=UPI001952DCB9|nr:serine/threonine-protein kinase 32C-like isoform X3 [Oreochromis aureus]
MCDPPPPPRAVVGECTNVPGGCRFNECLLENEKYKKESSRRICTFSQRGSLLNFDHFQILRAIGKGSFGKGISVTEDIFTTCSSRRRTRA